MNWRNWRFFGKVFVTVSCIFLGLRIELGWKEVSFGYKRNYQSNVTFYHHEQQQSFCVPFLPHLLRINARAETLVVLDQMVWPL
jgi:hypothetical protein